MKTFRFVDFPVYQGAVEFYKKILLIIKDSKDCSLNDQIKRASLSIILNIAEGSAVKSDKESARYLEKSLGSINEVAACLDVMEKTKLIHEEQYSEMIKKSEDIAKQLGGFKRSLLKY